jgi:MFS transporter, FHS family, glucose/mannose:H+ symporter
MQQAFSCYKNFQVKFALIACFTLIALLTGNVAGIILQLAHSNQAEISHVGSIAAIFCLSSIAAAILASPFIPKVGYKKTILIALLLNISACFYISSFPTFLAANIFFFAQE